eukprot:gi/632990073/ref/XP_007883987.1/ PREDICTED: antigen WC1.1-like [Callorhinchus milii]
MLPPVQRSLNGYRGLCNNKFLFVASSHEAVCLHKCKLSKCTLLLMGNVIGETRKKANVIFLERKMSEYAEGARVRLVNSGSPCAGRVEVYHDGQWGTVSGFGSGASGWDMLDAAVVCKELGCGAALSASGDAHFGEGSGPVVARYVRCRWIDSALRRCPSWGWRHYNWISHSHDAGVICSGK